MTIRWFRTFATLALLGVAIALSFGMVTIASERIAATSRQLAEIIMRGIGELVAQRAEDIREDVYYQLANNVAFAQALGIGQRELIADAASWQALFGRQLTLGDSAINALYIADPRGNLVETYRAPHWTLRVIQRQGGVARERLEYRAPDLTAPPLARIERETTYDPRERPWYQVSVAADRETWSPIYQFSEGQVGITLAQAVRDAHGQPVAVFGVDVVLEHVSDLLSRHAFGEHDVALIVNDRQQIVAHSLRLSLNRPSGAADDHLPTVAEIAPEQSWVARATELLTDEVAAQMPIISFEHAGARYLAFARPLAMMDAQQPWRLLLVAAQTDVLGKTRRVFNKNLALVALSLMLVVFGFFALFCNPHRSATA